MRRPSAICSRWRPHSALLLLLFLLPVPLLSAAAAAAEDFRRAEMAALLEFKRSITADPSGLLSGWSESPSPSPDACSWPGVSCDSGSRVSALNISGRGEYGTARPSCSSRFDPFKDGACSDSKVRLVGKLSPAIGRLAELRVLSLPFHGLEGVLPEEVTGLEKLEVVELDGNGFSGAIPARFGRGLRVLGLAFNRFSSEIPRSLSRCAGLEIVDLSHNQLNGTIPPFFGAFPRLRSLQLSFNRLGGSIPGEMGSGCRSLEQLDLSGNLLVGGIPASLGNCRELQALLLFSNLLDDAIPAELGRLAKLQVLDVSRNSLSGPVPSELGDCLQLSVLVLSNVYDPMPLGYSPGSGDLDDFNYFQGGIHENITSLPKLRILWAPRVSLEGKFPSNWGACESLEMVNLGQNLFTGQIPAAFGQCGNLKFLNLSSNKLVGSLSDRLPVPCMYVFDVSDNQLSGPIPRFAYNRCNPSQLVPDVFSSAYFWFFRYKNRKESYSDSVVLDMDFTVLHNFGENNFTGDVPSSLPVAADRLGHHVVYRLMVNGNSFFGSLPGSMFDKCGLMKGLVLNISGNLISGVVPPELYVTCASLMVLDASGNRVTGTIPSNIGLLGSLVALDLSRNELKGQIPANFSRLKGLKYLSLSGNNLTGGIPVTLGQLSSLEVLDLSWNSLSGGIPSELVTLRNLSIILLNGNKLSGRIPSGIANLTYLSMFNVSYNNLSGPIPLNVVAMGCDSVLKNPSLEPCHPSSLSVPPQELHGRGEGSSSDTASPPGSSSGLAASKQFNSIEIASITSAAAIVSVLLALIVVYVYTRKCARRSTGQASGRREVTVFTDIGVDLTYENVVRATGNFNASNCIGSGGFGATYKAEIAPGVLVAIKRLSIGRFQGVQQFHAEIKTLGRWRHPNLVTLIGYHVSEAEMFLIYNYLPGGNLENFIQDRSRRSVDWRMLHKIALDVARALAYLHDHCVPRILHRDVKPSNILLDNEFNAYLSDFGLARLLGNSESHATTGVAGTFGYVAPEYAMTCRVSDKADVYSYGVVLLELISDKKALDPSFSPFGNGFNIVAWACMLLRQGRAREFFTEGLWDVGPHDDLVETLHLAVMCTNDSLSIRPTMKHVVQRLKQLQPPTC